MCKEESDPLNVLSKKEMYLIPFCSQTQSTLVFNAENAAHNLVVSILFQ